MSPRCYETQILVRMALAGRLLLARLNLGVDREVLAAETGLSAWHIRHAELGTRISYGAFLRLCSHLSVEVPA